jgi:DNA-binding response OmpR family regulator
LLLVEDDELSARALIPLIVRQGLEVCWSRSVAQTRALLETRHAAWKYALVDDHLPDGMGSDLLPLLRELDPPPAVALVTAFYTLRRAHETFRCGALLLSKPSSSAALVELLTALDPPASGDLAPPPHRSTPLLDQQVFGRFVVDSQGLFTPTGLAALRAAERRLLAYLIRRAPQIASSAEIAPGLAWSPRSRGSDCSKAASLQSAIRSWAARMARRNR